MPKVFETVIDSSKKVHAGISRGDERHACKGLPAPGWEIPGGLEIDFE